MFSCKLLHAACEVTCTLSVTRLSRYVAGHTGQSEDLRASYWGLLYNNKRSVGQYSPDVASSTAPSSDRESGRYYWQPNNIIIDQLQQLSGSGSRSGGALEVCVWLSSNIVTYRPLGLHATRPHTAPPFNSIEHSQSYTAAGSPSSLLHGGAIRH